VQLGPNYGRNAQLEPPVCYNIQSSRILERKACTLATIPARKKHMFNSKEGELA
jgi:hypothetical protein